MFVGTANLSGALHRMLSEPKSKQKHRKQIYEFVVLNHVLSSNVASLTAEMIQEEPAELKEFLKPVKSSIFILEESVKKLDSTYSDDSIPVISSHPVLQKKLPDPHLNEQLDFINKISMDIGKLTNVIVQ